MGRVWKAGIVTVVTFVVVCGGSWLVCSYLKYPHNGEHRVTFTLGLAGVVATVVGSLMVTVAVRARSTVVGGNDNRVVGAGAHNNALGDRSVVKASGQQPGTPGSRPNASQEADESTVVRGKGIRAAGAGARDNALGDDSRVE